MERKIRELQRRVRTAREELAVLEEQIVVLAEDAEDARVRSLVAEHTQADRESIDAQRHLDLARRAADSLRVELERCTADRDRLLAQLSIPVQR